MCRLDPLLLPGRLEQLSHARWQFLVPSETQHPSVSLVCGANHHYERRQSVCRTTRPPTGYRTHNIVPSAEVQQYSHLLIHPVSALCC